MFVATMKRLAEHCEFKESLSEVIRDRLVYGLRSEAIQKRLLTERALTLDRASEISVSMEMAAKEAHQLSSSTTLHEISNETYEKQIKCYRCDQIGHVASECWSKTGL